MKSIKNENLSMKDHVKLIARGLKLFASFDQPVLFSKTLELAVSSLVPFINIYLSALIINELIGLRRPRYLFILVITTIALNFIAIGLKNLCQRWSAYCQHLGWYSINRIYNTKLVDMDYNDFEDPMITDQFSQIKQHQNGMGLGLINLKQYYEEFLKAFFQIVLAGGFGFTLFTTRIPVDSPYGAIDSALVISTIIGVIIASILLQPYLMWKGGNVFSKASRINNKSNRYFLFYFYEMTMQVEKGKDMRLYDQKPMIEEELTSQGAMGQWNKIWSEYGRYEAGGIFVSSLLSGFIYLYIALKAYAGAFNVGHIVLYVGALNQLTLGFSSLLSALAKAYNNNAFLQKVMDFLDIPNKKYQGSLTVEKRDDHDYKIEFKNVSFKYPGSEKYVLKDINLKFEIGKKVAIVGMNGSGKSTLIKLLCRLYDPTEGVITLNGIDIKKYSYVEYTQIFAMVFQDFKLLPFTLGQNVATSVDVDQEKVLEVLKKAGFDKRLETMPHGLETYLYKNLEEEGVEVSGGEAQKIALARALYKNAPFIVLDEPTAALDPVAEYEIYAKFNEIVEDKTAIYISHRLASCRFCDDIIVLHEGHVVQRGHHEELIRERKKQYFKLWDAQAQYYKDKSSCA